MSRDGFKSPPPVNRNKQRARRSRAVPRDSALHAATAARDNGLIIRAAFSLYLARLLSSPLRGAILCTRTTPQPSAPAHTDAMAPRPPTDTACVHTHTPRQSGTIAPDRAPTLATAASAGPGPAATGGGRAHAACALRREERVRFEIGVGSGSLLLAPAGSGSGAASGTASGSRVDARWEGARKEARA